MKKINFLIAFILLGSFILLGTMLANGQAKLTATTINISGLTGYEKDEKVYIEWSANVGERSNYWEVQSSVDGKKFSTVALVLGPDPRKETEQYAFKGKIKNAYKLYYRVVYFNETGVKQQSDIIKLVKQDSLSVNSRDSRSIPAEL